MKKILYLTLLFTISCFAQNKFLDRPLVSEIFTADPSAHLFEGKIYVYPSHDIIEKNPMYDDCGSQYAMRDYRVLSMDYIGGPVTIHDVALDLNDVTWAKRQFWAPDAAEKDGKYYLYFPTKDKQDIFKIGVAISSNPAGPFKPEKTLLKEATVWIPLFLKMMTDLIICILEAFGEDNYRDGMKTIIILSLVVKHKIMESQTALQFLQELL